LSEGLKYFQLIFVNYGRQGSAMIQVGNQLRQALFDKGLQVIKAQELDHVFG
jgi:hypothetical protein